MKDSRVAGFASLPLKKEKPTSQKEVGFNFFSDAIKVWGRLRIPAQPRENIIYHVLIIIVKLFHAVKATLGA